MNLKIFLLFVTCIHVVHIKIIHRMVFLHIIVCNQMGTDRSKQKLKSVENFLS